MFKLLFILAIFAALFACNQPAKQVSSAEKPDTTNNTLRLAPDQLITPGKGIGYLVIDQNIDSAISKLGKPDSADAAMGASLMTWYGGNKKSNYKISIFTKRNMGAPDEAIPRIKRIMITSPWYNTIDGVSTGKYRADIEKHFTLKQVANYTANAKKILVFDDDTKGITFDIDSLSGKCIAITVHGAGKGEGSYINMH